MLEELGGGAAQGRDVGGSEGRGRCLPLFTGREGATEVLEHEPGVMGPASMKVCAS